jgi:poly [ADP-ribose] polymerase
MGKKKVKKSKNESSMSISDEPKKQKKTKKSKKEKGKKSPEVKDVTPVIKIIDKKAVVDQHFADRAQYHICQDTDNEFNGKFFSCTLNKSDLDKNNNKFYIIQLLEHDSTNDLILFTRWGRVGVTGLHEEKSVDKNSGPRLFMKKYKDKLKHGYQEIFIDYETEVKQEEPKKEKNNISSSKKKFKNTLDSDVMELISLIYNKKMINDNLHEIGYDSQKMPLGKLSPVTLTTGLNILKQIESELKSKNPNKENLKKFSSEFYTQIPHNFGFQKMANFIINDIEKVKEKIDMISALSDMKITLKILESVGSQKTEEEYENEEEKQIHDYYKQLNCDIRSISPNEEIYSILNKYLTVKPNKKDSDGFGGYYSYRNRLSLVKAYELNRHGENEKFKNELGNKKLLWHGSRITNFVGILSQGLRIAPPEAPSSGYLYGKGVYFADMAQKSSNYCYPVNNMALILLGEVALGKEDQRTSCDFNLPKTMKYGTNSVHALGRLESDGGVFINGNVFVPNGDSIINEKNQLCNDYAEYIVYNVDQVKLRYLLQIRYN